MTHQTQMLYTDRDAPIELQYRLGSGGYDQWGVIVPNGDFVFAMAFERVPGVSEFGTDDRVGVLYELAPDGSNRARRIAQIRSYYGNDIFAVSADNEKFACMALRDHGHGQLSSWLVVLDRNGNVITDRPEDSLGNDNVNWLEWMPDGQHVRGILMGPDYEGGSPSVPMAPMLGLAAGMSSSSRDPDRGRAMIGPHV